MTPKQQGTVLLIKSALTGQSQTLPSEFDVSDAFEIAKTHGITAIIYYGAHNCGIDTKSGIMQQYLPAIYKLMMNCAKQDAAINLVLDAFEKNGIKHLPLKGAKLRRLYPKPEMRRMGDADILIDYTQYEKIRPLMLELGYTEGIESDHELHWCSNAAHIELHKRLIPSYNSDYYAYFGDGWKLGIPKEGKSFEHTMSPEDDLIYVFTHFAKHYRDAGIGIRHFVDLWLLEKNSPDLDYAYIRAELEKLQLAEFYENIMYTLKVWFEDAPANDVSEFISQVIFTSGQFGQKVSATVSSALRERRKGHGMATVTRKHITGTIFVNYQYMSIMYPILKKAPVLLPAMWVVYFFSRLFNPARLKAFFGRLHAIDEDDVTDYEKSLQYVGLDFNFNS